MFHFAGIGAAKSFLGAKQHNTELRICHIPVAADIFFLSAIEIKRAQNSAIAIGKLRKAIIYGVAQFQNFGLGPYAPFGEGIGLIAGGVAPHPAPVFENYVTANAIEEGARFLRISNLMPLLGTNEARQGFLHQIVYIRAVVAHMIENLVAQLKAETLQRRFIVFDGGTLFRLRSLRAFRRGRMRLSSGGHNKNPEMPVLSNAPEYTRIHVSTARLNRRSEHRDQKTD